MQATNPNTFHNLWMKMGGRNIEVGSNSVGSSWICIPNHSDLRFITVERTFLNLDTKYFHSPPSVVYLKESRSTVTYQKCLTVAFKWHSIYENWFGSGQWKWIQSWWVFQDIFWGPCLISNPLQRFFHELSRIDLSWIKIIFKNVSLFPAIFYYQVFHMNRFSGQKIYFPEKYFSLARG